MQYLFLFSVDDGSELSLADDILALPILAPAKSFSTEEVILELEKCSFITHKAIFQHLRSCSTDELNFWN